METNVHDERRYVILCCSANHHCYKHPGAGDRLIFFLINIPIIMKLIVQAILTLIRSSLFMTRCAEQPSISFTLIPIYTMELHVPKFLFSISQGQSLPRRHSQRFEEKPFFSAAAAFRQMRSWLAALLVFQCFSQESPAVSRQLRSSAEASSGSNHPSENNPLQYSMQLRSLIVDLLQSCTFKFAKKQSSRLSLPQQFQCSELILFLLKILE